MNWESIRNESFSLSEKYVYMNNSTMGATLNIVSDEMVSINKVFREGCNGNRLYFEIIKKIGTNSDLCNLAREILQPNTTTSSERPYVGFVNSVTEGISLVANGITFHKGDEILITTHEHNGCEKAWELQTIRYEAKLTKIPLLIEDEDEESWRSGIINRFKEAFKKNKIKVVAIPWITSSTGHILPVKEICELASKHGAISVIDAAQAFGILPIDFHEIGCDFLVANYHKYLCGPIGTGFIAVHKRILDTDDASRNFWPTIVDRHNLEDAPYKKGGVGPYTNIISIYQALKFYKVLTPDKVYQRLLYIGQWLRRGFSEYPDIFEVITPSLETNSCVMTCFKVNGMKSEEVYNALIDKGVHLMHSEEGGADSVRISPHYYNTKSEFDLLIKSICEIASVEYSSWPKF